MIICCLSWDPEFTLRDEFPELQQNKINENIKCSTLQTSVWPKKPHMPLQKKCNAYPCNNPWKSNNLWNIVLPHPCCRASMGCRNRAQSMWHAVKVAYESCCFESMCSNNDSIGPSMRKYRSTILSARYITMQGMFIATEWKELAEIIMKTHNNVIQRT